MELNITVIRILLIDMSGFFQLIKSNTSNLNQLSKIQPKYFLYLNFVSILFYIH